MAIRVQIYEDNDDVREMLSILINNSPGFEWAGAFMNCRGIVENINEHKPDVILMDLDMPEVNGLQGIEIVHKMNQALPVLVLTVFDDDQSLFDSLCLGAHGYLLKGSSPAQILQATEDVYNGGAPMSPTIARKVVATFSKFSSRNGQDVNLSPREKEILTSMVKGNSYKLVAAELSISIQTVKTHIKNVYEKLHVHSQSEAVAKAIRERLV